MIESVMMDQEEIKDDQQQQGTTEEEEEEDSSTDLVVPTETTVILVDDDDDDGRRVERSKETGFEMSKEEEEEEVSVVDKLKANVVVVEEEEESEKPQTTTTCVIDVKCNVVEGNCDVEKVCRICHLSADPPPLPPSDNNNNNNSDTMIQLGCGCKGELGIAHRHCAETWFKLKGNRCCEICGEAAKNITGMWDDRFMEDWNDRRSVGRNSLDRRWGFWRGQPFCNFLMACLVMAFVLPWFFRVNMF